MRMFFDFAMIVTDGGDVASITRKPPTPMIAQEMPVSRVASRSSTVPIFLFASLKTPLSRMPFLRLHPLVIAQHSQIARPRTEAETLDAKVGI
jgi:hypothetical protein